MSSTSHTVAQIAVAFTSLYVGFCLGARSSLSSSINDSMEPGASEKEILPSEGTLEEPQIEEAQEHISDGDLSAIKAKGWEPCKLVLVVRTDLKLQQGDISAQCADATLACYKALVSKNPRLVRHWETTGQAKIALKGTSDEQLLELEAIAKSLNLCARAVHSEDLTGNRDGTRTVLGIGPAPVDIINQVTGKLKLL